MRILEQLVDGSRIPLDLITVKFAQAAIERFAGRSDIAITLLNQALETAEREGILSFAPMLFFHLAWAHQARGDFATSEEITESRLRPLHPLFGEIVDLYYFGSRGLAAFLQGSAPEAAADLDTAAAVIDSEKLNWAHVVVWFARGQARSEAGLHDLLS